MRYQTVYRYPRVSIERLPYPLANNIPHNQNKSRNKLIMRAYQLSTINRYTVDQFNEESKIEATGKKKKSHPPSLYFVFHIPYSNMMLTVCMIPFVNFDNFCLIQLMFTKHIVYLFFLFLMYMY